MFFVALLLTLFTKNLIFVAKNACLLIICIKKRNFDIFETFFFIDLNYKNLQNSNVKTFL